MIAVTIGPGKQYPSIQHAINQLVTYVDNGTLATSVEMVVYEGNYGGFIIPANSIGTSSSATLTIKAAPQNRVVLSGAITSPQLGHGFQTVGVGVGDGNTYVTIKGLRIENFLKGIVLGAGCNNCDIIDNYVALNNNVGIWVYRSDNCSVINNVVLDHDNGLVVSDVKDIFIAHNDLINLTDPHTSQATERHVLYITSRPPNAYGAGGAIVMYNNNLVSSGGGRLIGYGANVISKLRSDHNNLYNPGGVYAHSLLLGAVTPDVTDLAGWKAITNGDAGSISTYPEYYIATQAGNSIFTNVNLQNFLSFNGIARGLNDLANAPTAATTGSSLIPHGTVPSYVTTSILADTIQSNFALPTTGPGQMLTRPNPPSIGAYDINNDPNGFGSSVLPVGVPTTGVNNNSCIGAFNSGINVVEEKYGQSVDCINPRIVPGFFYVRDMQHYLYSKKAAYTLSDITTTDIVLGAPPHDSVTVKLDKDILDQESWRVEGNILRLYHKDLALTDLDRNIELTANILKWTGKSFEKRAFKQQSRIRDGHHRYFLPVDPTRAAPIVITDDMVDYSDDPELLGGEFRNEWDAAEEKTELIFGGANNLIENPQFDYTGETSTTLSWFTGNHRLPDNWGIYTGTTALIADRVITTTTGTTGVFATGFLTTGETEDGAVGSVKTVTGQRFDTGSTGAYNLYPYIGNKLCVLTGNGIRQRVRIDEDYPYWVSTYSAALKATGTTDTLMTGALTVSVDFYDLEMRGLTGGALSTGFTTVSDYTYPTGHWTRNSFMLANTQDTTLNKTGLVAGLAIPSSARFMDVTIGSTAGIALDAISVTQSLSLERYKRRIRGGEATVEYDTGLTDLYTIDDLTVTPIRNRNHNGFLYIGGVPAWQFDTGAPDNTTTLTDWGWPDGRVKYLPWARTSGKNKLRCRPSFNINTGFGQLEDVVLTPDLPYPDAIETVPRVPIANLSDGVGQFDHFINTGSSSVLGVNGSDFTVMVRDNNGNPYAFEWASIQVVDDVDGPPAPNFIGLLGNKELGFYREFGQTVLVQLDSAGSTSLRWIPPSAAETMVEVSEPSVSIVTDNGENYIDDIPYRINEVGMGNAFLSTPLKPEGYDTIATGFTDETLAPTTVVGNQKESLLMYKLPSTPHRESMSVWINKTGMWPATGTLQQTYDLLLPQAEKPEISEGQYFVDEARRLIFIRFAGASNDTQHSLRTRYKERHTFVRASSDGFVDDRRLYLSDSLKTTLTADVNPGNPLSVNYDILVDLIITAKSPVGMKQEFAAVDEANAPSGKILVDIRERTMNTSLVGKAIKKRVGHGT